MDNFIGFVIDPYTYKVARARKDGVVRGHGFAGSKPAAWAFLAGAVGRGEMAFAQYADTADGEKHNLLVVARCRGGRLKGKLTKEGRHLMFVLLPDSVLDAVRACGGRVP